jgi:hypothetical protein
LLPNGISARLDRILGAPDRFPNLAAQGIRIDISDV